MYAGVPSQSVRSRIETEIGLLTSAPSSFLESSPTPFMPLPSPSSLTLLTSWPRTYRRMANSTPTQLTPYPRTPQPPCWPKLGNGFGKSPPSLESKLCQGKIPTKVLLNTRQIVQDATCLLCHFKVELSLYILRDCPLVPPIWAHHTDHTLPNDFDYSNTFGWFKKMATHKHPTPQSNISWCVVFPVVLWSIWLVRNKLVMEEICFESNSILKRIASTSIDLFFILPTNWRNSPRTSHLLGWKPPPTGFFQLNTDGSAWGNLGGASAASIIRDASGSWIGSCSRKIDHTHSMAVELWGL